VFESIPHKKAIKSGVVPMDVVQIIMPSLDRTSEFLAANSPSLSMLKFLDIVLSDIYILFHERRQKQPAQ
jgi:hypothetical protein